MVKKNGIDFMEKESKIGIKNIFTLLILSMSAIQIAILYLNFMELKPDPFIYGIGVFQFLISFYLFRKRNKVVLLINQKYAASEIYIDSLKGIMGIFGLNFFYKIKYTIQNKLAEMRNKSK